MNHLDPALQHALARVVRTLLSARRGYCVIGALVPRLLMPVPPAQRTRDVDLVVEAASVEDVEALTRTLQFNGYTAVAPPIRFRDESGIQIDVIPFGEALAPNERLVLPGETLLRTEGLRQALDHPVRVDLEAGLQIAVAPLPLYAMLKLSAYADRHAAKDLNGFLHCARHYEDLETGERRYGLEHDGALVPLEYGGALLLGLDGVPFQSRGLRDKLRGVLSSLEDEDAPALAEAAHDVGHLPTDQRWRTAAHQLLQWYRVGCIDRMR